PARFGIESGASSAPLPAPNFATTPGATSTPGRPSVFSKPLSGYPLAPKAERRPGANSVAMQGPCSNLTPFGRRARLVSGIVTMAIGIAMGAALIAAGARWWWRVIVFIPFWAGALGLLQAREST